MKKFLEFYMKALETGHICAPYQNEGDSGLCEVLEGFDDQLFKPSLDEFEDLHKRDLCTNWWGSGLYRGDPDAPTKFTPLRQNMVLLMAAMNDEL